MAQEGKIFYGWWIVAATFVILFAGLCTGFYTVSVFLEPLQETFGWSKTQISLGFTFAALLVGLLSPAVGVAVAKLGVKKVQAFGALVVGLGLVLAGSVQHLWQYYSLYIIIAVGLASVSLVPAQTVISYWFDRKRGLAMGIIMTGIGLGGMVMVFIAGQSVAAFGWRWAYRILGFIVLGIVLPAILLFIKERPQDLGLVQDGTAVSAEEAQQQSSVINFTVKQAFRTLPFYLICLIMALYSIILGGMTQHAIALLRSMEISEANLFWSLTLGASVFGRIIFGTLADKVSKKVLIIVVWGFHVIGLGSLYYLLEANTFVWGFVVFYGIALGSFPTLFPLLLGEKFGVEHFSKLVGIAGLCQILGLAAGAILLGRIFDTSGSYFGAIQILIIISLVSMVVTGLIGKPKSPEPVLVGEQIIE
jgi:MFS family permease